MSLVSDLIASIYDQERDDWTKFEYPAMQDKAFRFSATVRHKGDQSSCEVCIWGPHNYIGVFVRWTNHYKPELEEKWMCLSYHDSCWRDALGSFSHAVLENRKDHNAYLNCLWDKPGMCTLPVEELEAFLKLERSRREDQIHYSTQEQYNLGEEK